MSTDLTDYDKMLEEPDTRPNSDWDPVIPEMRWVLLSVISPTTVNAAPGFKWDQRLLKVKYVCRTYKEAQDKTEYFRKLDDYHHIFIAPVGRWTWFDDRDECAEEINHGDERMNEMLNTFREQTKKAEDYELQRRINAKTNASKHQKMLEERRKKAERKIKKASTSKTVQTTENIIASELITENVNAMQNLSIDDLRKKMEQLEKGITNEDMVNNGLVTDVLTQPSTLTPVPTPTLTTNPVATTNDTVINTLESNLQTQEATLQKIEDEYLRIQEQLARYRS
jgi:hypothetical protein